MSIPAVITTRTIVIRNGRAWAGLESEPVVEGRHPRVAAMALAVRLYGKTADVRELNAYNVKADR